MWFDEVTLIKETYSNETDEIGNPIVNKTENTVFCDKKSLTRTEFYSASTTEFKPSIKFIVYAFEYNNENKLIYLGQEYNIIRTYLLNSDEIELTCEKVISNV